MYLAFCVGNRGRACFFCWLVILSLRMLMIRLQRTGRKNDPQFRVVVTEKQNGPKSGKFLEVLGSYNPKLGNFTVKKEKVQEWVSQGAQMSDTIFNHLVKEGIIEGKKKNVLPKKSPSPKRKEKK